MPMDLDAAEAQVLAIIAQRALGFEDGRRVAPNDQLWAMQRLQTVRQALKDRDEDTRRHAVAVEQQQRDAELRERQVALAAEASREQLRLEEHRLLLDAQRIEVERALVIVRAFEAVAAGGPDAHRLLPVVQALGERLLGGKPLPDLAIECEDAVPLRLIDAETAR